MDLARWLTAWSFGHLYCPTCDLVDLVDDKGFIKFGSCFSEENPGNRLFVFIHEFDVHDTAGTFFVDKLSWLCFVGESCKDGPSDLINHQILDNRVLYSASWFLWRYLLKRLYRFCILCLFLLFLFWFGFRFTSSLLLRFLAFAHLLFHFSLLLLLTVAT